MLTPDDRDEGWLVLADLNAKAREAKSYDERLLIVLLDTMIRIELAGNLRSLG